MGVTKKKIIAIVSGVIALIALVAYAVIASFDINSYKSKVESVLSESTGLSVKINGKVGLSFFPFGVSAKDIHVSGRGGEILSLKRLKLGAELLPLLKKKLNVNSCVIVRPTVSVVKDLDGRYNFQSGEKGPTKGLPRTAFTLKDLKLSEGTFVSIDKKTGEKTEVRDINLAVRDLTIADISGEIVKNVSFTGNVGCKEIFRKDIKLENLKASVKAIKGTYDFEPLTMGSLVRTDKKTGEKTEVRDINLAVRDLTIADISGEIVKNVSFTGNVGCKEIFRKDIKLENLKASVKAIKGTYDFEPLTMGSLVRTDKKTGEKTEVRDINLAVRDLTIADISGEIVKNVSFTGNVGCKEIFRKDIKLENLKASVKAIKGTYDFEPLTMGSLVRTDKKTGEKTEVRDINLAVRDLTIADISGEIVKNVSFTGNVGCKEIFRKDIKLENLKASVKAIKGTYDFEPLTMGSLVCTDKKTGEKTEVRDINLAVRDLTIADISGEIVKNVSFTGNVGCKEIFRKDIKLENLKASVKAIKGTYDFEPLTMGSLVCTDKKTGEKTEVRDINLAVRDLTIADISGEIVKNVSFTGNVGCKEIFRKNIRIERVTSSIKANKGIFQLKPFTMYILGRKGKGGFTADISKVDAIYNIDLRIPKLDFEKLAESFGVRKVIGGKVDLVASLTAREKGGRMFLKGVYGTLSLRGNNLITYTVDLDKVLSAFEASQKFSLLDIGAFFITGPLGSVALRGYRYGDLYYQSQGGRGTIRQFVSRWKIKNGEAEAIDCALATRHNRVALKGKLNLVEERYDNVIVALLDNKGCAKFKQSISGPFGSPQVGAIDVVESVAAPLLNLLKQTQRFVQGGRCQVFYNGSVRPPR